MDRRDAVVALLALGGLPLVGHAQGPALPVIGFLSSRTSEQGQYLVAAIRQGLKEVGYVEGQNVAIEYRWAEGHIDRLPALAAELVKRQVAVIIAGGTSQSAKDATTSVPIVFTTGFDPIATGIVSSLSRPGGNLTGATFYSGALGAKQFQLLRELVPKAGAFGLLVKADHPGGAALSALQGTQAAAQTVGRSIQVLNTRSESDFEPAFATLARRKNPALIVSVDPYFDSRVSQLVTLARRYAIPVIYSLREFVHAGGLVSYGSSITDTYRQAGVYAGQILKGAKPSELPVLLPTKFELVINRKTAKALRLTIPQSLLVQADDVIE
jgi:putative ABC transport system substrate-binding protein